MLAAQALTIANVDRAFSSALTLKKKKNYQTGKKHFYILGTSQTGVACKITKGK